ncbi:hypothetical protein HC729_19945 [Vibrio sp. S12_S33]|nr:hypothetical protein [Vibrio sp. S12_S33]
MKDFIKLIRYLLVAALFNSWLDLRGINYHWLDGRSFFMTVWLIAATISITCFLLNYKSEIKILSEMKGEPTSTAHYIGPILDTKTLYVMVLSIALIVMISVELNHQFAEQLNEFIAIDSNQHESINLFVSESECQESLSVKGECHQVLKGVLGEKIYY